MKSVGRCGQPLASYTTDPHDIFEAVIHIHWTRPTASRLTVGCFYVEIERLSSHELLFAVSCRVGVRVLCTRGNFILEI